MKTYCILPSALVCAILSFFPSDIFSKPVEWEFPRLGSCHEGLAFADGKTGVLVWGGGDTMNLTVGRSDLWDHRGGYPWTPEQSYTNIVSAVESGDRERLYGLFKKETLPGEPRNPYMLPFARVAVRVPGAQLKRGELDPFTGCGRIFFGDGKAVEIAMCKARGGWFSMKFPEGVAYSAEFKSCMEFQSAKSALEPLGFRPPEILRTDSGSVLAWKLPADPPASIRIANGSDGEFALRTWRGEKEPDGDAPAFDDVASAAKAQWARFWSEGAKVRVPDPLLQEIFDYGMYRFGAMTDPDGTPAGLQGPWLEDDKLVPWNGDYHFNINVQECYSPAYRGGHFSNLMPLFRMVLSWRPLLRDNARKFCGIDDGYVLPHSVDDRGVCIGGFWTGTIDHGSTAWVAAMMFRYVKYSGDVAFLKDGAYDFMKGAINVYRAMMEDRGGRLSIPLGPSPEWGGDDVKSAVGRNPSFQLAAAHRLARDLVSAAQLLGEEPDAMWLDVEKRLPQFASSDGGPIQLFEGTRLSSSHRHHSHMAGLYPFDTIDVESEKKIVYDTYMNWIWFGKGAWTGWCVPWASVLHVHMGYPVGAIGLLHDWERYFCDDGHGSHHNAVQDGFTCYNRGLGVMQMDGQCAAATAVMELLAHEVDGKVEFFRGCPPEWKDVSFENLALSDGTRVDGRRLDGKMSITPHHSK